MRYKKPKLTTEEFMKTVREKRKDSGLFYDYSKVEYTGTDNKIIIICPIHGEFTQLPRDHRKGHGCRHCAKDSYKTTCLEKYGVDNFWKRTDLVAEAMMKKHGVTNPGMMADHVNKVKATSIERYGIEWAANNDIAASKRKQTNIKRYGFEIPAMNKSVSAKIAETKIKNGSFDISNSSREATNFFRDYYISQGYSIDQVAFADIDNGLHEWGFYYEKWHLFDFVAFEKGYRGDSSKILEIVEYHGPFHYTIEDVLERGDDMAKPWKSSSTTIRESYEKDRLKELLANKLTTNFKIIWAYKEKKI